MRENLLLNIKNEIDVRQSLSELRSMIKEGVVSTASFSCDDINEIIGTITDDDAKARKNCALLLMDLSDQVKMLNLSDAVLNRIISCYQSEDTLFVRANYLKAISKFELREEQLSTLKEALDNINSSNWQEADLKHVREEKRLLEEILSEENDVKHRFLGINRAYEVLLTADEFIRESLQKECGSDSRITPKGVRTSIKNDKLLRECRLYRECLFLVPLKKDYPIRNDNFSDAVVKSALIPMLKDLYELNTAISFRVIIASSKKTDVNANLVKRVGFEIEEKSSGILKNVRQNPEIELRFFKKKDEGYTMYLKLNNPEDMRFIYRREAVATSLSPVNAAAVVGLCKPYLKDKVQTIDPFAGTGALLIERCISSEARQIYAIDTFGEAVAKGRINADAARLNINYINRNFFDFKHDYLFDEIITEFPQLYDLEKNEVDNFYQKFFDKAMEITSSDATLIILSGEGGRIKKNIRINEGLHLEREFEIRKNLLLYIIGRRA